MYQEKPKKRQFSHYFTARQFIVVICALFILVTGLNILLGFVNNILMLLNQGDVFNASLTIIFLMLITFFFIAYLYIGRFLTRNSLLIAITVIFMILLILTGSTIEGKGEQISLETFIYFLVIGFLLLFIFIFTVENIAREKIISTVLLGSAIFAILTVILILVYLTNEGSPIFWEEGVVEFLFGTEWIPDSFQDTKYGALPLIWATLVTSAGAIIISVPISLGSAIFISELAPMRVRLLIKPIIELLAGIPSVVIGFFGLIVLVVFLQEPLPGYYFLPSGSSSFAGMLILAIMALPTITSVSEDAINSVPIAYKEASLAVGATKWQTINRVTLPAAASGITAAIILGTGRAIGETMAVMMVMGNSAQIEFNIFESMRTITGSLAIEMGETAIGSTHYHALFGLALILLLITIVINFISMIVVDRLKISYQTQPKEKNRILEFLENNTRGFSLIFLLIFAFITSLFLTASITFIGTLVLYSAVIVLFVFKKYIYNKFNPYLKQKIAFTLITSAVLIVIFVLLYVITYLTQRGLPAITIEFLTQPPEGLEGGIFPAIVGTIYLVIGTIVFALPIGVSAAIYLVEYQKEGRLTKIIRAGFDLLNGTPSIVFGLFGFAFFVISLFGKPSMLAGQITLGLMILPTVLRTTEEALKSVPQSVREGSLALGATRWQTIRKVVLPPALPGILTGAILSIGRAAGETAPILFTAAVFIQPDLPNSLLDPVMALPYHLFLLTEYPASSLQRFGTALVLLSLVIALYFVAIVIRNYYSNKIRW